MALNSTELFDLIKDTLVKLAIKKNHFLSIGINPEKVNNDLRLAYSYWILVCDCSLTQNEIDCIVDSVRLCNCTIETNTKECIEPTIETYTQPTLVLSTSGGVAVTQIRTNVTIPCSEMP